MELGKKIRTLRLKAGFTQEQLAEKLGIGPQAVSKWENAAAMPDVAALPVLAEVFGVTVDDLFDLTVEQRFRRIENRMDIEEDLPQDVFLEYEEFLKERAGEEPYEKRATELLAYLYWHKMNAFSRKAGRYARDAVRRAPGEKTCYWMLAQAERHAVWDWNVSNHHKAIGFYREIVESDPGVKLPYLYLLDNLLADHRAEEAEAVLARYAALPDVNPVHVGIYRAYIALARFDEPAADRIVEELEKEHPDDFGCLCLSVRGGAVLRPQMRLRQGDRPLRTLLRAGAAPPAVPGRADGDRGHPRDPGRFPEGSGGVRKDRRPAPERVGDDRGDRTEGRGKGKRPAARQSMTGSTQKPGDAFRREDAPGSVVSVSAERQAEPTSLRNRGSKGRGTRPFRRPGRSRFSFRR